MRRLIESKQAAIFLILQFVSDFGDQISSALLALCLLDITNSTAQVGSVYLITTLGYVFFTFVGGWIGDRLSRQGILVACDIARGFVVLAMIVALRERSINLIYATSFCLAVLDSLHRPVKLSAWTDCVPREKLERFTSLSELSNQGSTIIGPLIASWFVVFGLTSLGFALDAFTFFICAYVFSRIVPQKIPAPKIDARKTEFLNGFKLIAKNRQVAKYVAYDAIMMVGFGAFNATFLILAQRDFGFSKLEYSYHLSIIAGFTIIGAMLGATKFISTIEPRKKLTACAILSALSLLVMLQLKSFPLSSIMFGICDGLSILTMAVTRTKVQLFAKDNHPEFQTAIIAARGLVIKIATLFGTGLCLLVDDFISLESTLFFFLIPVAISFLPFFLVKDQSPESIVHNEGSPVSIS